MCLGIDVSSKLLLDLRIIGQETLVVQESTSTIIKEQWKRIITNSLPLPFQGPRKKHSVFSYQISLSNFCFYKHIKCSRKPNLYKYSWIQRVKIPLNKNKHQLKTDSRSLRFYDVTFSTVDCFNDRNWKTTFKSLIRPFITWR